MMPVQHITRFVQFHRHLHTVCGDVRLQRRVLRRRQRGHNLIRSVPHCPLLPARFCAAAVATTPVPPHRCRLLPLRILFFSGTCVHAPPSLFSAGAVAVSLHYTKRLLGGASLASAEATDSRAANLTL